MFSHAGVPQGSVIGPLFCYDLPECIYTSIPFLFADDTKCLQIINSSNDITNFKKILTTSHTGAAILIFSTKLNLFLAMNLNYSSCMHTRSMVTRVKKFSKNRCNKTLVLLAFTDNLQWSGHYKNGQSTIRTLLQKPTKSSIILLEQTVS